jgi:glycosyltransferase involved in cell wall biosynthesis
MTTHETLFSVVIPHLNQADSLDICLSSLDRQTLNRSRFEVIVVDNGSSPSPDYVVARHPNTTLLHELQPGPGPARNRGVRHSVGEFIAFIDADCRAHPDWLSSICRALECAPKGTILGGDVQIWRANAEKYTAIEAYESVFSYPFKAFIEQHGFCGTGNMALRRNDFDKVGPFGGIQFAEDVEWGQRARTAGLEFLYVPEVVVFHPARSTLQALYRKWDRHIQHAMNAGRGKTRWWTARWVIRAAAVLCSALVDGAKILCSDRVHGVSARLKALLVLAAVRAYRAWKMIGLLGSTGEVVWNRHTSLTSPSKRKPRGA